MTRTIRAAILIGADVLSWMVATALAAMLRYDFALNGLDPVPLRLALALGLAMGTIQVAAGLLVHNYSGRNRLGGYADFVSVTISSLVPTTLAFLWLVSTTPRPLAMSIPLIALPTALVLMLVSRGVLRGVRDWRAKQGPSEDEAERVVVFGAGEAAEQLIRSLNRSPSSRYLPVAILDDDPAKSRRRIDGVHVRGNRHSVASVAENYGATGLLIAVPSANSSLISDLDRAGRAAGLKVYTLPSVAELVGGNAYSSQIREVEPTDLLGRHPVEIDTSAISALVAGKVVLVTGAGGSIGSELCRQIAQLRPRRLVMLDRDESALHAVQLSISGKALLEGDDLELADLRDAERINEVFAAIQPDLVFHAAALKHLSLLETHPQEAWKTNVEGTLNVLRAAQRYEVKTLINISTDKAANPTCVLGYSKRITERLTSGFASKSSGTFANVRFGNVLGSRGSMLGTFVEQIEAGGPVTVTHPEIARYFMTIPEAAQLVMQAGALAKPGEVLILDMGDEIRIDTVARRLIERSGRDIEVEYTGLRTGEKLHEELLGTDEVDSRPNHPLITQARVPPLSASQITGVRGPQGTEAMRSLALHGVLPGPAAAPGLLRDLEAAQHGSGRAART